MDERIYSLGATQILVGLSAIVRVGITAIPNWAAGVLKNFSGGSLEIVTPGPTLGGTSGVVWGTGYMMAQNETVNFQGPTVFYLAATGSTVTAHLMIGYSQGATII